MAESIVGKKSYAFALIVIKLCKELSDEKEFVLSKQLLKSGTSIGANVEEALAAQSRRDFITHNFLSVLWSFNSKPKTQNS